MIETLRLLLRPININDASAIYNYSKNENVGRHAGWSPHVDIDDTINIMRHVFIDQPNVFGIELKDRAELIGSIGLALDPKRQNTKVRMIGYAIGEEHWGNGYITEAATSLIDYGFDVLKLDLISAYCYPYNIRSKRVLQKCGFSYEGTLSLCERRFDGVVLDNECYALKK